MVILGFCEAGLRILGGRDALKDEFPFAIRLENQYTKIINGKTEFEYVQFCTGAALTPSWILTAAHCGDEDILKSLNVFITTNPKKFARYNSYFPQKLGQLSPVTRVLIYPGYELVLELRSRVAKFKYDLALFQTENVRISQYAKISAIDYASLVGHEAYLLGFGGNNAIPTEKPLQVLKSILIKCDVREGKFYGLLCIVPRCGVKATTCRGDSGGPVVHGSGIVGVVSAGAACDNNDAQNILPGYPASFISMISPAIDWISNVLANKTAG
nr:chymotrypsin-1-like [Maniola hyperantus]